MRIGILGSGRMGAGLGRIWAACGHELRFAYSRSPARLARLAQETGGRAATVAEAAAASEAVLLAVIGLFFYLRFIFAGVTDLPLIPTSHSYRTPTHY